MAPLIGFRLEERERRRATERALKSAGDTVRALGDALAPGAAIVALLVEHVWRGTLEDAIARSGGAPISSGFVDARTLADVAPALVAAAESTGG